jgi:hypothetical protein
VSEISPNPFSPIEQLELKVSEIFADKDYQPDEFEILKVRRKGWHPDNNNKIMRILTDADWSAMAGGDMPTRLLQLSMCTIQEDGISDTHTIVVEIFGALGHQVTAEDSFRKTATTHDNALPNENYGDFLSLEAEAVDDYFQQEEIKRLATNDKEEIDRMRAELETYNPTFEFELKEN